MSTADAALNVEERASIAEFAAHYPLARAACIDALKYVQARRGYVADSVLPEIASILGISVVELDEVATFYNLIFRRPVGEKVLLLCNSVTCWMLGEPKIAAHISRRLGIRAGETTADGKYTLLPIVCLGHCDHAPAMMWGDALYGDLDAARVDILLHEEEV